MCVGKLRVKSQILVTNCSDSNFKSLIFPSFFYYLHSLTSGTCPFSFTKTNIVIAPFSYLSKTMAYKYCNTVMCTNSWSLF